LTHVGNLDTGMFGHNYTIHSKKKASSKVIGICPWHWTWWLHESNTTGYGHL